MTIEKQMEILEIMQKRLAASPEATEAFFKAMELRTGIKLRKKRKPRAKKEKK